MCSISAQTKIKGKTTDSEGYPIANVAITFGDSHTQSSGSGNFVITIPDGSEYISATFKCIGYKDKTISIYKDEEFVPVVMIDSVKLLNDVAVQSAKYGKRSNYSSQITNLSKFDINTNPNALGDLFGGLRIVPGVESNETDGRLIIQGGASDESKMFIDGLLYFNPYTLQQKNTSSRGRFSPDLFQGVALQSAGYGAEYGDALSGIVNLSTLDKERMASKVDININSTGVESSVIRTLAKTAFRVNASYMNLTPYGKIFKDDYDWEKFYNQCVGDFFMINKLGTKATLKSHFMYSKSSSKYTYNNVDDVAFTNDFDEDNFYGSLVGNVSLSKKWSLYLGANYASNTLSGTDVQYKNDSVIDKKMNSHLKAYLGYSSGLFKNRFGAENIYSSMDEDYMFGGQKYNLNFHNNLSAVFDEVSLIPNDNLCMTLGLRYEHASLIGKSNFVPRLYLNYRINSSNNVSFSAGEYNQLPKDDVLKFSSSVGFRKSQTATVSYCYAKNVSKLQVDMYYKNYRKLTTYRQDGISNVDYGNLGDGKVKGLNAFWKWNYRHLETWVSYSYIDADIFQDDYNRKLTPAYLAKNRFNVTAKYWIAPLRSLLGASFFIDDGAKYYNNDYNIEGKTPSRNKLDLSWSYLPSDGVIIHFSWQNVYGRRNIYGYEQSALDPGKFKPVQTSNPYFFYLGVFITLSNNHINQIKSL